MRATNLGVGDADGALLPVPRRELVADLGDADGAHAHLDELLALVVGGQQNLQWCVWEVRSASMSFIVGWLSLVVIGCQLPTLIQPDTMPMS